MASVVTVVFGKPIASFILEPKSICFVSFTFSTRSCSGSVLFNGHWWIHLLRRTRLQLTSTVFNDNLVDNMHVTELYTLDVLGFFNMLSLTLITEKHYVHFPVPAFDPTLCFSILNIYPLFYLISSSKLDFNSVLFF